MSEEGESRYRVLFRVYQGGNLYSIPVRYVAWVEPLVGKITIIPNVPEHIVGMYNLHGKNISIAHLGQLLGLEHPLDRKSPNQNLLIIRDTRIGFLVETVLGVEKLHSWPGIIPFTNQLVSSICFCDSKDDLIFDLDLPNLVHFCCNSLKA